MPCFLFCSFCLYMVIIEKLRYSLFSFLNFIFLQGFIIQVRHIVQRELSVEAAKQKCFMRMFVFLNRKPDIKNTFFIFCNRRKPFPKSTWSGKYINHWYPHFNYF